MADARPFTTQLQAGLGMINETMGLLQLWEPGETPAQLAEKAIARGALARTTARRGKPERLESTTLSPGSGVASGFARVGVDHRRQA